MFIADLPFDVDYGDKNSWNITSPGSEIQLKKKKTINESESVMNQ
jgi:hypothetical protein